MFRDEGARRAWGPEGDRVITLLTVAIMDPDPSVAYQARTSFGRVGEAAVPALIAMLKGGDVKRRVAAAEALRELGPEAIGAVDAHRPASRARRRHTGGGRRRPRSDRNPVARGRGCGGPAKAEALRALAALVSRLGAVCGPAVKEMERVLARVGAPAASALAEALDAGDAETRVRAAETLAQMYGTQPLPALKALGHRIRDGDVRVRLAVVKALRRSARRTGKTSRAS